MYIPKHWKHFWLWGVLLLWESACLLQTLLSIAHRLGQGERISQLCLYLCPATDSPLSVCIPPRSQKEPLLFTSSPICQDHSFRLVSFLSRGLLLGKDDYGKSRWKGKMQMILNLFLRSRTSSSFSSPLYLMISISFLFKVFPVSRWPLIFPPWFLSVLISFLYFFSSLGDSVPPSFKPFTPFL